MRERALRTVWMVLFAGLLAACGGGGGGSAPGASATATTPEDETGKLIIGITDAPGDFVSYEVDVDAIRLEKANGTIVEALPLETRIDFAELTEVTELLTVATVPVGTYVSASLTLDYTDATVLVQDDNGGARMAEVFDESGAPAGIMNVRLMLTDADAVRIVPGAPAAFSLDFDLDASNEVTITEEAAEVTVSPFLLATAELEADREHRVRGVLAGADPEAATITMKVRPFRHRDGRFGELTVLVDPEAEFEVNGEPLGAEAGLEAVAALPENTPLIASGMIVEREFVAFAVLAGTSVPWTAQDVMHGVVAAREGDALSVRGALVQYADGLTVRRDLVTVLVGPETRVTALGVPADRLSSQSISVGQRVVAFGELDENIDVPTLNATEGRVRMKISQFTGSVVQADPLVVNVHLFNGRRPGAYDFSGTGTSVEEDADPARYEVATSTLGLLNITESELVRVRGLVNEFGMAPPDFLARSVIDPARERRPASFAALWPADAEMPVAGVSRDRIDLDLTEARSVLKVRGVPVGLTNPLEAIALVATDNGRGVYAVRVRGSEIHLFRAFEDFAGAVLAELDEGRNLRRAIAHGGYNGNMELTSRRAAFDFSASATTEQ